MQDLVPIGTGNSRYLKSVENFKMLYPTYDNFVAALVDGTLPVDFNGINMSGIAQIGTALNKANLLTDDTAALFGLGADVVPNDVLAFLGRYNCHWWSVLHGEAYSKVQEVLTPITSAIQLTYELGNATIKYSKEISISSSTLAVSLVNPETLTFDNGRKTEVATALAQLISMAPVYITESVLNDDTIFYIPAGATNGTSNACTIYYSTADDGYVTRLSAKASVPASIVSGKVVIIPEGETTYVNSNDRNAYPDSGTVDGMTYKYLGIPFDNAVTVPKIAVGSYVGTGTYGSSNPNSLTFDFSPMLLMIRNSQTKANPTFFSYSGKQPTWVDENSGGYATVTFSGNTVQWYSDKNDHWYGDGSSSAVGNSDPKRQLNISNVIYHYIAIG